MLLSGLREEKKINHIRILGNARRCFLNTGSKIFWEPEQKQIVYKGSNIMNNLLTIHSRNLVVFDFYFCKMAISLQSSNPVYNCNLKMVKKSG